MEENNPKHIENHFEAGSNCQVFNGNLNGCVFAMPGSNVTLQTVPPSGVPEAENPSPAQVSEVERSHATEETPASIVENLPPADVFVNRVKDIVTEAARKNGGTIPANPRGLAREYTFFVDGGRIAKMMDDLRKNHEAKINEFLCCTSKYDGVMIVAPFIGRLLQMEELRARDLQLTDLEFAFSPYYNNTASAVKRMSTKLDSAEANMLFSLLKGMLKKYPKG